ncbi:MAG: hypothetical protein ACFFCM_12425 [Promethearchaeota archaeon]
MKRRGYNKLKTQRKFSLHFEDDIVNNIYALREVLAMGLNEFMEKTLKPDLFAIEADITSEKYDIVIQYFNLSRLIGIHTHRINNDIAKKKNIIEIKFPLLMSRTIHKISDTIHWKPERFIEDVVSRKINEIVEDMKNRNYDFLTIYLDSDLTEIVKLINQIYKKDIKN